MEFDRIDEIIDGYERDQSKLVQILLDVQVETRWLPPELLQHISERLNLPLAQLYHVASFYKTFHLEPRGRNVLAVCVGTACHVRGAQRILDKASEILEIPPDTTTADEEFSLDTVNCLGCCALGPVVVMNGETHGKIQVSQVEELLSNREE
ncbi:MAG: NAD(P)H-dependent oxidoreductase subunit E [Dehalococcoidia bacterium]